MSKDLKTIIEKYIGSEQHVLDTLEIKKNTPEIVYGPVRDVFF